MNSMQRYSRELVAAGAATKARRDTSLVWRGQVIDRVAAAGEDDTDATAERGISWLDRVVAED